MTPQADQFDWDDTSEVRPRASSPDLALDGATLHALEVLASSPSGREARTRAVALRAALGPEQGALEVLIDRLVARSEELERLRRLAGRDELTGIANRRAFNEALERALSRARRARKPISVLLFDLDGLKAINDGFGHAAGDEALRAVAARAQEVVRNADLVARLGGDELVVLLPDTDRREAKRIGERIREELIDLRLGISFGVATAQDRTTGPNALLEAADRALYRDKTKRKTLRPSAV